MLQPPRKKNSRTNLKCAQKGKGPKQLTPIASNKNFVQILWMHEMKQLEIHVKGFPSCSHNEKVTMQVTKLELVKLHLCASYPINKNCIFLCPPFVILCRVKPQGGNIFKIRGLGRGNCSRRPCSLGMSPTHGLYLS